MTITYNNWLGLDQILINDVIGSVTLAYILALVFVVYFGVKNNMPVPAIGGILLLVSGLFLSYSLNSLVLAVIGLIVGVGFYAGISKLITR